uniref:Cytochrome c-552/4 domain-containing protein n=1 Tax=Desulfobacca acetoxidans TaxID=60893 RepID=A0A7V4G9Y5_9BACT
MEAKRYGILGGVLAATAWLLLLSAPADAANRKCPPFHLKTEDGKIINPLTGENADQPYSPRQTCGPCHNYDEITKGFHFQQGWDKIKDTYSKDKPWVLSDGMVGKM